MLRLLGLAFLTLLLLGAGAALGQDPTPLAIMPTGCVHSLQYSPDGKWLATGNQDYTVTVWSMPERKVVTTLGSDLPVREWLSPKVMAFSPDGKTLATAGTGFAGNGFSLRLWDTATWKERDRIGGTDSFQALAYSPDGKLLATGDAAGVIRFWDPDTLLKRGRCEKSYGMVCPLAFSPDGKLLASGGFVTDPTLGRGGPRLIVWNVALRKDVVDLKGGAMVVAFSPDGKLLAGASGDGTIQFWDATLLPRDGGTVKFLDTAAQKLVRTLKYDYGGLMVCAQFSPDGKLFAASGSGKEVHLWDTASGELRRQLKAQNKPVRAFAFSPDGKTLAAAEKDGSVWLWDLTQQ